jgi:hypothetical protein
MVVLSCGQNENWRHSDQRQVNQQFSKGIGRLMLVKGTIPEGMSGRIEVSVPGIRDALPSRNTSVTVMSKHTSLGQQLSEVMVNLPLVLPVDCSLVSKT